LIAKEWKIGTGLGIGPLEAADGSVHAVTEHADGIEIEGVKGQITGRARLYASRISAGKSDEVGASNGFHVNIFGRVVNVVDPYFGLQNLSHSVWAQFRATVKADGMDEQLRVNREGIWSGPEALAFQAFLLALFNKARQEYDSLHRASWPDAGAVLTEGLTGTPLDPLTRVVGEALAEKTELPGFVDASGVKDIAATAKEWTETSKSKPDQLVTDVAIAGLDPDAPLARYDLGSRRVIVNRSHPFFKEHGASHEEQLVVRDTALADLLTDAYMLDIGITESQLREARTYKDRILRLVSQLRRRSGPQLASMLRDATAHPKGLERVVGDAIDFLGFDVVVLGRNGEPEGIATAPATPGAKDIAKSYSFTYDAKSSGKGKVKTKDLNLAILAKHSRDNAANHTLVVAPDFELGTLQEACKAEKVTPIRAKDLGTLLMSFATSGAFDLTEFRNIFELFDPDEVEKWVGDFTARQSQQRLNLGLVLQSLSDIGYKTANAVTVSVIADRIAQQTNGKVVPKRAQLAAVMKGLESLVPHLLQVVGEDVYLKTSPEKLRDAILAQLAKLPADYRFGADEEVKGDS